MSAPREGLGLGLATGFILGTIFGGVLSLLPELPWWLVLLLLPLALWEFWQLVKDWSRMWSRWRVGERSHERR